MERRKLPQVGYQVGGAPAVTEFGVFAL